MPDNKEEEIPYHSSTPPKISAQSQHIETYQYPLPPEIKPTIILKGSNNYEQWKTQIDVYFQTHNVDELMFDDLRSKADPKIFDGRTWRFINNTALAILQKSIDSELFMFTNTFKGDAYKIYKTIREKFELTSTIRANELLSQVIFQKYKSDQPIEQFLIRKQEKFYQVQNCFKVDDAVLKYSIITSLPSDFQSKNSDFLANIDQYSVSSLTPDILARFRTSYNSKIFNDTNYERNQSFPRYTRYQQSSNMNQEALINKSTTQNLKFKVKCTYQFCRSPNTHTVENCWYKKKAEGKPTPLDQSKMKFRNNNNINKSSSNDNRFKSTFFRL